MSRAPRTKPSGLARAQAWTLTDAPLADAGLYALRVHGRYNVYQFLSVAAGVTKLQFIRRGGRKPGSIVGDVIGAVTESVDRLARALNPALQYKHLQTGSAYVCGVAFMIGTSASSLKDVSCPTCRSLALHTLTLLPFTEGGAS